MPACVVLVILIGIISAILLTRSDIDTTLMRSKGMLFQQIPNTDSISNLYTLHMVNKTYHDIPVTMKVEEIPGNIKVIGNSISILKKESTGEITFFVMTERQHVPKRKNDIKIGLYAGDKKFKTLITSFFSIRCVIIY